MNRLKRIFGTKFASFDQLEIQALVTADIEKYVDSIRMCQITGKHPADIKKLFQGLVGKGALVLDGQGRWTRYFIQIDFNALHRDSDLLHKKNELLHKKEKPDDKMEALYEIAVRARQSKRLLQKEMEKIILSLCQNTWLNRRQLGDLLNRNAVSLASRFLTPMVRHGLLRLRYPEKPNRVDQAYMSVDKQF